MLHILGALMLVAVTAMLVLAIRHLVIYCTLAVQENEIIVIRRRGELICLREGKTFHIPFVHQIWRASLVPIAVDTCVSGLENLEGLVFKAHIRAVFRMHTGEREFKDAAAAFFGRTEEQIRYILTELVRRDFTIFFPAYDRRMLEYESDHLLGYVEGSVREDAAALGMVLESFSFLSIEEDRQ